MTNIEDKRQEGRRANDRRGADRRDDATAILVKSLIGILVALIAVLFYFFTIG